MTKAIELQYGEWVNIQGWNYLDASTVFSVEGYARKNGKDPAAQFARAVELGHDVVGTIKTGTVIHNYGAARYELEDAPKKAAKILVAGQRVIIEGREYTVKPIGARYSDPIHFIAA